MFNLSLNPYIAGNPVGNGECFIGRKDILREVNRVFSRSNENAIVLYGQRRIGKTSVLQYLQKQLTADNFAIPIFFDLQDKSTLSIDQVINELSQVIAQNINIPKPNLGDNPQLFFEKTWLPETLEKLDNNKSIVLLFDEFDVLAAKSSEQAGSAFFPYLRKLLTLDTKRLNFVFVIGRNVNDLDTIALSLFKGIPTTRVSLLSKDDTNALCKLSEDNGTLKWPGKSLEHVWRLTNGHAFFSQQLCSHVWEHLYDNEPNSPPSVKIKDIDSVIQAVIDSSRNTLEWLWDGLPPAERVVSSALAEAGCNPISERELQNLLHESGVRIVIRELEDAPRLLKDWDLLESVNDSYRFRVELLRLWIKENKPLNRVQEELDRIQPLAENLFLAAQGFFNSGDFADSEKLLNQALGLNPNHIGANQTLADIFLAENRLKEAKTLLERLFDYQPAVARPRLIQSLLGLAGESNNEEKKLEFFSQVLIIDPNQNEAEEKFKSIWNNRANNLLNKKKLRDAENAYKIAGNTKKMEEVRTLARKKELSVLERKLDRIESQRKYAECIDLIDIIDNKYKDIYNSEKRRATIKKKLTIDDLFIRSKHHMKSSTPKRAYTPLSKIVSIDPTYNNAISLLYEINTGIIPKDLIQENNTLRKKIQEVEATNSELELTLSKNKDLIKENSALREKTQDMVGLSSKLESTLSDNKDLIEKIELLKNEINAITLRNKVRKTFGRYY